MHLDHEFNHDDPQLTLIGLTPAARETMEAMGLLPFATNLTVETYMPLVVVAKITFDPQRESILVLDLEGNLREVFLLTEVIHEALHLPNSGGVVPKTKTLIPELNTYFSALEGTLRDGLPIENIYSADLKCLTKYIGRFLEVSRHNRIHQIHKRFFYIIHMWLDKRKIVNWRT